ncbi:MAG: transcriptional regulator [Dehalococcoidia bacterium]|nr:transcriptional regulator [Dehalococcoidia bacterium]
MEQTLHAIAEPSRREILRLVHDKELTAGEIAAHFEVTRPAISQHLRVLREAELVTARKEGTRRMYRARPEGLEGLREYLQAFWTDSLSALKEVVEANALEVERGRTNASDR